jgi:hypothetical protein
MVNFFANINARVLDTRLVGLKANPKTIAIRANLITTFGVETTKVDTPLDHNQHGMVYATKDISTITLMENQMHAMPLLV